MTLTKGQQRDLDLLLWFYPCEYTDAHLQEYFDFSERGIKPKDGYDGMFSSNPLIVAKSRRGLQLGMWEEGILDLSVPYHTLLGGESRDELMPRYVVDFMKKEMFRGIDAETIETAYQRILKDFALV